jgi:hypothetical protein
MKKLLLVSAIFSVLAGSALAEDNRDQAFGKHDMGPSPDSSMNKSNSATGTQGMASSKSGTTEATKRSKKLDK